MKAIKNFNAFKKSLLSATNGNMVESFDSSNQFGGCEYQSYRVYVDDVHYYNMFVIYNFATNTYDVSLETSMCAVSTMTRVCKTQKAMIDSVVRWCYYSYLHADRCTESEKTETNKIKGHIYIDTDSVKVAPLPEQQTSEESITDTIIADDTTKYGNSFRKHLYAIMNPNWHHVSLATLANIDNDMLEEKRRHYMKVYRMTANVINTIYKCNKLTTIDKLRTNLIQTVRTMAKNEKIEWALVQYVKAKIDNCYLLNGLQSSFYSKTYGYNKSRSYTKTFCI